MQIKYEHKKLVDEKDINIDHCTLMAHFLITRKLFRYTKRALNFWEIIK